MRSLEIAFYLSIIGVGGFLSSFLIIIVDHITIKDGKSWIGKDLNESFGQFLLDASNLNYTKFMCLCILGKEVYLQKNLERGVLVTHCLESDGAQLIV